MNFREYIDRLFVMVQEVSEILPLLQDYGILFKQHNRVQSALVKVYLNILEFCVTARDVFAMQDNAGRKCKLLHTENSFHSSKLMICARAPSGSARPGRQSSLAEF
jgi:hypothetical protein